MTMASSSLIIGLLSALTATIGFGSFAAPVKLPTLSHLSIHPLAFQTYKSSICLLTSWLSLVLPSYSTDTNQWVESKVSYTPWGIVSAAFWVPGGIAAIYAVQNAGLAVSQGVWSSAIVMVSFAWGILAFGERVKSGYVAAGGVACMIGGLWGMSFFSKPDMHKESGDEETLISNYVENEAGSKAKQTKGASRRAKGLAAAVFNGLYGGSIMVPMKWAPDEAKGMGYVISFAIGAAVITAMCWVALWLYHSCGRGLRGGFKMLPSMHFRELWFWGSVAGMLWSAGNIASMLCVQTLGEAVGYSICQSSLLVSGLWGMFYFKEVTGTEQRLKWAMSAVLTLIGIVALTWNHAEDEVSDDLPA